MHIAVEEEEEVEVEVDVDVGAEVEVWDSITELDTAADADA